MDNLTRNDRFIIKVARDYVRNGGNDSPNHRLLLLIDKLAYDDTPSRVVKDSNDDKWIDPSEKELGVTLRIPMIQVRWPRA